MGRARPRAAVAAFVAVALGGLAAAQPSEPPLRAMRWLAADADVVQALTRPPPECLPQEAQGELVQIGRAAFRTPVLLGGQAARAGLSCESCHRNGRNNSAFHFPGISGAPGTADVTSSLFSTHRGNGVDDPKPIPDLGGPKAKLKVSQAPGDAALEGFIHGLIVEEFDGPEPPPAVLKGLAAYVRALDPARCAPARALRPGEFAHEAQQAAGLARSRLDAGDAPSALVMIAAARAQLGLLDERYGGMARLRALDSRLAAVAGEVRAGKRPAAQLARIAADIARLIPALEAAEPRSLFDPERLSEAAKRRLPRRAS